MSCLWCGRDSIHGVVLNGQPCRPGCFTTWTQTVVFGVRITTLSWCARNLAIITFSRRLRIGHHSFIDLSHIKSFSKITLLNMAIYIFVETTALRHLGDNLWFVLQNFPTLLSQPIWPTHVGFTISFIALKQLRRKRLWYITAKRDSLWNALMAPLQCKTAWVASCHNFFNLNGLWGKRSDLWLNSERQRTRLLLDNKSERKCNKIDIKGTSLLGGYWLSYGIVVNSGKHWTIVKIMDMKRAVWLRDVGTGWNE